VINTPLLYTQGSETEGGKTILGLPFTCDSLRTMIFNDRIWPDLVNDHTNKLKIESIENHLIHNCNTLPDWDVIPFETRHGVRVNRSDKGYVHSTVYMFKDKISRDALVIYGDVEPDIVTGNMNYLKKFMP